MRHLTTLTALAATLALTVGCGSGSSSSGGTIAPAASSALTFRTLDRGDTTGMRVSPPDASASWEAPDAAELTSLWTAHQSHRTQPDPEPQVDFTTERVVGLFLGERPSGGFAIEVVDVAAVASQTVEVRYERTAPQGAANPVVTAPYHIVAVNDRSSTLTFVDVTPATGRTLSDAHGQLVLEPSRAGGDALAFLEDGAAAPLELTDPSALVTAGAHVGTALTLSGSVENNAAGLTGLPEAARVTSFTLDDVAASGRLQAGPAATVFEDVDGTAYAPLGPLAAALLAHPLDRPVWVTGRIDPAYAGPEVGLTVTSWRPTSTLRVRVTGGLMGVDEHTIVDDLLAPGSTGAYRYVLDVLANGNHAEGRGHMRAAERSVLEGLVANADLPNQPARFQPTTPVLDVPTTYVDFADQAGDLTIQIDPGSTIPQELTDLLQAVRALEQGWVAQLRTADVGQMSQVTTPGVQVVRDQAAFDALWQQHAPGTTPPTVDFATSFVVAAFQGTQTSGGYAIEVETPARFGDDLYLTVERTSPAPGQPVTAVITSPYHVAVVDHRGATGDVWVDGVKQ